MAKKLLVIFSVLLVGVISPSMASSYGETTKVAPKHYTKKTYAAKDIDVVVEGVIYCQSFYKVFETTADGYFYAELKGFDMKHPFLDHPLQSCSVKLVSSPLDDCDAFTNVNYGINGAALRYEDKRTVEKNYEAVIYAAGPLAFRSDHCPPKEY